MTTALLIAARNPAGSRNGRIAVLETAVRSLQASGVSVVTAAITKDDLPETWLGAPLHRVAPESSVSMLGGCALSVLKGRTLNEGLFSSARIRRELSGIASAAGADFVVGDGLRVWEAASATGLPVIMHLDDLLSDRYGSDEFVSGNSNILGYFASQIPSVLRGPAEAAARKSMAFESKRAYAREIAITRAADACAMTSPAEAATLSERAGRPVAALPMAVDARRKSTPSAAPADRAVFLGVLHFGPNIAAVRYLRDSILPAVRARGRSIEIDVIGAGAEDFRAEFDGTGVNLLGYADDLEEALGRYRMFLSPILSGTGVKTKVLDGMSVGLPVVATTRGVEGIAIVAGEDYLLGDTPEDFAAAIIELMDSPERADELGARGRLRLTDLMSTDHVSAAWAETVRTLNLSKGSAA